ncbi:MAG TPA: trehalose-6-phosphate synthase [Hyphomicrobiaceae bacterium]|nr:trehalose-6-phosphate synthase [Hyphomicrobiaceae bacterium]
MSRLIVVSNRVADPSRPEQAGGLAVGVLDALKESGGLWFGWDGTVAPPGASLAPTRIEHGNIDIVTVPLTEQDYQEFYLGFSNSALWPVFHYRLDLARFSNDFLDGYRRVNARFARAIRPFIRDDDLIWVHDYHLIPLASELRAAGVANPIGFFLHIPFPPPEVLVATPEHEWLIASFLDYDLVGFQTATDLGNFERFVRDQLAGGLSAGGRISARSRSVNVGVFPVGIDVDSVAAMASTADASQRIERLHRRALARVHIIGVDRLDYTKGLPERLRAFRRLLELYPENMKAATLMQIAAPTREDVDAYADIRRELEQLSGAINGTFGDFDWTPVRYVNRTMPRDTLAALFRGSHVGLVTPLRDGMNLVAKEYVAAQEEKDPGVLILSRFAGAAEDLEEALIVNPYDADEVAQALQLAIKMPIQEKRERYRALLKRVRLRDAKHWRDSFLKALRTGRIETVT